MRRPERQIFWISLGLSLFLFLTAAGLVAVDSAGRALSFGDTRPALERVRHDGQTTLEVRLFFREGEVNITKLDNFFIFLLDFCCIPHH